MKKFLAAVVSVLILCAAATVSVAEFKFDRPINVIVPFNPGGTSDLQIRVMQPYLEKKLGANLVIINLKGGSGILGTTEFINSYAHDGFTILYSLATPVVYKPLTGSTKYNYFDDLQAVSRTMSLPMYLILADSSNFKSAQEVLDYIKANPGKFSYANVGNGGNGHLAFASFLYGEGLKAKSVPYSGGTAECYTALIGKEVDAAVYGEADLLAKGNSHGVINLGDKSKVEALKDIPTFAELGYSGYSTNNLGGFFYQKDVPAEAVEAFDSAVKAVLEDPEFIEAAQKGKLDLNYGSAAEFDAQIRQCSQAAEPIMKELGYGKKKK